MGTGDHTILLVHGDEAWREHTSATLQSHGFACIGLERWPCSSEGCLPPDIATVAVQVAYPGGTSAADLIAAARDRLPGGIIIAIVPPGDVVATRAAFRGGAWDCLEEPVAAEHLADVVADAAKRLPHTLKIVPAEEPGQGDGHFVLPTHSAFLETLGRLRCLCRRLGQPLSIMMFDLDRFREYNELHSPTVGDQVLDWFGSMVSGVCRRSDSVARYQGDRFIAALPDSRAPDAAELAQRCRRAMGDAPLVIDGRPLDITVSAGIAESTAGFIETEHQLIQRARIALDQAKHQGGDRIVSWSELLDTHPSRRELRRLSIDDVSHWVERLRHHLRSTYVESTRALVAAVEAKDPYTRMHSLTVAGYAEAIGKRLQLSVRMIETLRVAALLHDVGKIGVPDAILTKPGPLTRDELEIIQRHPETAVEILAHVSFLSDVRPLILHHHERIDGTGYPSRLAGDRIPIGARILAVADALDTMFSPRSYKKPYMVSRVRAELSAGSGRQFDTAVADVTLGWLDHAVVNSSSTTTPIGTWLSNTGQLDRPPHSEYAR